MVSVVNVKSIFLCVAVALTEISGGLREGESGGVMCNEIAIAMHTRWHAGLPVVLKFLIFLKF